MRYILPLLLLTTFLFSATDNEQPLKYEQQKQIFDKLQKSQDKIIFHEAVKEKVQTGDINETQCFDLKKINIVNSELISEDQKTHFTSSLEGQCVGMKKLNRLVKQISNYYIDHGYMTSLAYLRPQDMSDGVIEIYVNEGKIEDFTDHNLSTKLVFLGLKGEILNIRDIEVGLEQLNRLSSNHATLKLHPSKKEGYSLIEILNKKTSPLHAYLSVNNYGAETTGVAQLSANLTWDSPFNINDKLTVGTNGTGKVETGQKSLGHSADYSVPFHRLLATLKYSSYEYAQTVVGTGTYISRGISQNFEANINYKLFHAKKHKVEYNLGFVKKQSKNYVADVLLDASSYELGIAQASLKYIYQEALSNAYIIASVDQGTDAYDLDRVAISLDNDFTKFILDIGYTRYFKNEHLITYALVAHAQHTDDDLFSTEVISIGGPYSVRGFKLQGFSGNSGIYLRNDLSIQFDKLTPYVALDAGSIKKEETANYGDLIGSAFGVKANYKALNIDLFHSVPLSYPDGLPTETFTGINLSLSL